MKYPHNRTIPQWLIFGGLITCAVIALVLLVYMIKNNGERSRADDAVDAKITEAERLAEQRHFDEAIRLMEDAAREPKATNPERAVQTLQRLQGMKDAALKSGKLDEAKRLIEDRKMTQSLCEKWVKCLKLQGFRHFSHRLSGFIRSRRI